MTDYRHEGRYQNKTSVRPVKNTPNIAELNQRAYGYYVTIPHSPVRELGGGGGGGYKFYHKMSFRSYPWNLFLIGHAIL